MKSLIFVALTCAATPACTQEVYDLLLKGGHVIDLKSGRNGRFDVAITDGRISAVAPNIHAVQARTVITVSDYYVTPGLIDLHAYVYPPQGVDADHNALRYGVTTIVDGGSAGPDTFERFRKQVIDRATVRVLAFIRPGGSASEFVKKHADVIVGVRASKTADSGPAAITVMAEADDRELRRGDIRTHAYAEPVKDWKELRTRGILFDVGHGADGFLFRVAAPAIKAGFLPDTISTGLDSRSVLLPRPTMTAVMSRFLAMGLSLEQVIERTTMNPALAIKRADLGAIEIGGAADLAVFEIRQGRFAYLDSAQTKLTADRELRCVLTIRDGKVVWDTEGLSLTDWRKAGPYSNFK